MTPKWGQDAFFLLIQTLPTFWATRILIFILFPKQRLRVGVLTCYVKNWIVSRGQSVVDAGAEAGAGAEG